MYSTDYTRALDIHISLGTRIYRNSVGVNLETVLYSGGIAFVVWPLPKPWKVVQLMTGEDLIPVNYITLISACALAIRKVKHWRWIMYFCITKKRFCPNDTCSFDNKWPEHLLVYPRSMNQTCVHTLAFAMKTRNVGRVIISASVFEKLRLQKSYLDLDMRCICHDVQEIVCTTSRCSTMTHFAAKHNFA